MMLKLTMSQYGMGDALSPRGEGKPRKGFVDTARAGLWIGLVLTSGIASLGATDVSLYQVKKGLLYTQIDAFLPTVDTTNGYAFEADVYPAASGSVLSALVQVPGSNAPSELTLTSAAGHYKFSHKKNGLAKLDAACPNGMYAFTIHAAHDGTVRPSLDLMGSVYPPAPYLNNFSGLQTINPNGYTEIRWNRFSGGSAGDFIRLNINDVHGNQVFQTPNLENLGALDGEATYLLLAPGVLATDSVYSATLDFQKNVVATRTAYPEVLGVAGYFAETAFDLATHHAAAPDVKSYELAKGTRWLQSGSGAPTPEPLNEFEFSASVKAYVAGILVTNGSLYLPPTNSVPTQSLTLQSDLATLSYSDVATNGTLLDGLYGSGAYGFDFTTPHDGAKALSFAIGSVTNVPPPPQVENLPAFQTVNADQPLTVSWQPWTDGTSRDYIEFRIEDHQGNKLFASPTPGHANTLSGVMTNTVVPAGTLHPGTSCRAILYFRRMVTVDTTNYPGVLGTVDYYARTRFDIVVQAAGLSAYSLAKGQVYLQSGAGAPELAATDAAFFQSTVQASSPTSVVSSLIITPIGLTKTLSASASGDAFSFLDYAASSTALDALYPNGTYGFQVTGPGNLFAYFPFNFSPGSFPTPPHLANYPAAQAIDPSSSFTLTWDPLLGTANGGFVQLVVSDLAGHLVYATPDLGQPGAATITNTSATLPVGTLAPGQTYSGSILFQSFQVVDSTNYAGATGYASLAALTRFSLVSTGGALPPAIAPSWDAINHSLSLSSPAVSGQAVRLDGTTNLPPQWAPVTTNIAAGNAAVFHLPVSTNLPRSFFRTVILP
jgi:hypothetical protein